MFCSVLNVRFCAITDYSWAAGQGHAMAAHLDSKDRAKLCCCSIAAGSYCSSWK